MLRRGMREDKIVRGEPTRASSCWLAWTTSTDVSKVPVSRRIDSITYLINTNSSVGKVPFDRYLLAITGSGPTISGLFHHIFLQEQVRRTYSHSRLSRYSRRRLLSYVRARVRAHWSRQENDWWVISSSMVVLSWRKTTGI